MYYNVIIQKCALKEGRRRTKMQKGNNVNAAKAPKVKKGKSLNRIHSKSFGERLMENWQLILLAIPGFIFYIIFRYGPMYGLVIAFKDYGIFRGIIDSPWAEPVTKHFIKFFNSGDFWLLFKNTAMLGAFGLLWSFPVPILFALLLNEVRHKSYKKFVQTATYLPSFLSIVVVCSMLTDMLSPSSGIFNNIIKSLGGEPIYFLVKPEWFRTIYIASDVWAGFGYNAIIYLAALSGVDPQLYEAATIDGCGRIKSMWHVTLPGILPTIATMFILNSGRILNVGADKLLLLYNPATYSVADTFSTYVYRKGIGGFDYSYSTAVGLFNSLVALMFVLLSNWVSRKFAETSLW